MGCQAVANREVKEKGKASIEYYKDGIPQYFCYGWIDNSTEALIETCLKCKKNVIHA